MDELSKNQIVLLTLLVSFVTSIATGIVTVTLMNQAPLGVTQTINRVVERTIEKVVPGETKTQTVVKEVPVIITEEQLIVDVINKTSPATVRIAGADGATLGTGFIVSAGGIVATAGKLLPVGDNFQLSFANRTAGATRLNSSVDRGVALLQINLESIKAVPTTATSTSLSANELKKLPTVGLADTDVLPGQTVVALGLPDTGSLNVAGGIVASIFTNNASSTVIIKTNAVSLTNLGGPLLNTKGKAIGLNYSLAEALAAKAITETIEGIKQ